MFNGLKLFSFFKCVSFCPQERPARRRRHRHHSSQSQPREAAAVWCDWCRPRYNIIKNLPETCVDCYWCWCTFVILSILFDPRRLIIIKLWNQARHVTGCVGHIHLSLFWTSIYRCSFFFYCQLLMMMGSMQESWPPLSRVRPETFLSMLMTWKMDGPLFASHRKRKVSWVSWKFYWSVSFRKYLCRVHLPHVRTCLLIPVVCTLGKHLIDVNWNNLPVPKSPFVGYATRDPELIVPSLTPPTLMLESYPKSLQ